jgi:hypothetical protein
MAKILSSMALRTLPTQLKARSQLLRIGNLASLRRRHGIKTKIVTSCSNKAGKNAKQNEISARARMENEHE